MVGDTNSFGAGNKDLWILKLNSDGTVNWQKIYGKSNDDFASSIQQTTDGGYIVVGGTNSFGARNEDLWILKLNSNGIVSWQKTYGGTLDDVANSIKQTSGGDYIVAGYTKSFGEGGANYWVLKIDSNGNIGDSCDMIASTSVIPADTSVSANDTFVTPADTSVSDVTSSLIESDSSLLVDTQCLAETSAFSYDIDRFTQVGGLSGSATFVDEFDDDIEPPSGPSGPSTYVPTSFPISSNRESGGLLNLNSEDAGDSGDPPSAISIGIDFLADPTVYFVSGSGGMVAGKFRFTNGITKNSGFDIGLFTTNPSIGDPSEEVFVGIEKDVSGNTIAWLDIDETGKPLKRSTMDITSQIGTSTDLTLILDISDTNVVTASIDIGSDGIDVLTLPGSHTLSFFPGLNYSSSFGAGMDLKNPSPDIKANGSDGPVMPIDNLSVTVSLDPGSRSGDNADWWVVVNTPFGWYHYNVLSGSWIPGLIVTFQGSLFNLTPPFTVLSMSGLPPGIYTFYFGVDMVMNGSLDMGSIYYDSVVVNITE